MTRRCCKPAPRPTARASKLVRRDISTDESVRGSAACLAWWSRAPSTTSTETLACSGCYWASISPLGRQGRRVVSHNVAPPPVTRAHCCRSSEGGAHIRIRLCVRVAVLSVWAVASPDRRTRLRLALFHAVPRPPRARPCSLAGHSTALHRMRRGVESLHIGHRHDGIAPCSDCCVLSRCR